MSGQMPMMLKRAVYTWLTTKSSPAQQYTHRSPQGWYHKHRVPPAHAIPCNFLFHLLSHISSCLLQLLGRWSVATDSCLHLCLLSVAAIPVTEGSTRCVHTPGSLSPTRSLRKIWSRYGVWLGENRNAYTPRATHRAPMPKVYSSCCCCSPSDWVLLLLVCTCSFSGPFERHCISRGLSMEG
jgi:hypothetical protein